MPSPRRLLAAAFAFAASMTAAACNPAQALTISLDFVTGATTDIAGVGTTAANYAPFGFTGLNTAQIQSSILAAVVMDYLGFPTVSGDPLSPLGAGKQLDIDFVLGNSTAAPANGDSEYYFVAIGTRASLGDTFLGQACIECVRTATGAGPNGTTSGKIVGSILVDNIASALADLASTDLQRVNLLAETVAHEIGHSLSLVHPSGPAANPGASAYSIMGTGVSPTFMPNGERILDRAFSYPEMTQLAAAVGVRDVPEPASWLLLGFGTVALLRVSRRRGAGPLQPAGNSVST